MVELAVVYQACVICVKAERTLFSFFNCRADLSLVAPNVGENISRKSVLCCLNMTPEHQGSPNGRIDPSKRHRV